MFWRYNLITGSCIETLLDRENVTLKELLDEDDILQECKAQLKKLLDFLVRPEVLDEMVTLIITEPSIEGDERMRYKYANKACELLTFDIAQINDALVSDVALIDKLYGFLKSEGPLNPLLASFFSKTMGLLITKKTEFMYDYLKDKNFVGLLLNHLNTSAIMDLLLGFRLIENNEMRMTIIKWLDQQKLIQHLISRIDVEYSEEFNCNASQAICDIIKMSREHMSMMQDRAEPDPLLEAVESAEVVTDLLNHMFKDVTKESAIVNGILVLQALLVFRKQGSAGMQQIPLGNQEEANRGVAENPMFLLGQGRNNESEPVTALDAERLADSVQNIVTAIIPRLEDFHNLLLKPPSRPAITFTIGCLDPPLGNCRLEVTRLLSALLYTNNHLVNVKLCSLGTIPVLMEMFCKYSWNNFLHTQVVQIVGRVINNPPTVDEEGNKVHPLLDQLLTKYKVMPKIVCCFEEEPVQMSPGVHRKGYMGHLTKIANHIVQNIEDGVNCDLMKDKIKELPEDQQEIWEKFVVGKLADINKKNRVQIFTGPASSSSSTDVESIEFRDVPFGKDGSGLEKRVHLAFSDYQMHEMTSNFVDQFGFNDDEFEETEDGLIYGRNVVNPLSQFQMGEASNMRSAELFEEVCNAKLSSDDEAVLWGADRDNAADFSAAFQMNKSVEENSSDSDEESNQVFEAESTPIVMAAEDMKMDVDSQEAILDGVPMEVAPVAIANPWGVADNTNVASSSEEQQNWADFSNFSAFEPTPAQQCDVVSSSVTVAMETSDISITEKFDVSNNIPASPNCIVSGDMNSIDDASSDIHKPAMTQPNCIGRLHAVSEGTPDHKDGLGVISDSNVSSTQ